MAKKRIPWDDIERAFKDGLEVDEIVKHYKVAKKTLQNKIAEKKWRGERNGKLNAQLDAIKANLGIITMETYGDSPRQEAVTKRIETILKDNLLIGTNRELLAGFQELIADGLKNGTFETAQDIRAGVGAIKDIETVANPNTKADVQVTNVQAVQQKIEVTWE